MEEQGLAHDVVEAVIPARHAFLASVRHTVRAALEPVVDPGHLLAVEMVASELTSHVIDAGGGPEIVLRVQPLRVLTSVRVRCRERRSPSDEIFALRERVLQRLTVAFGERVGDDGSFELWAEVWRPAPGPTAPDGTPAPDDAHRDR